MRFFRAMRRVVAAPLAVVFLFASVPFVPASARLVGTEEILAGEAMASERRRLESFLQRQDVQAQLQALGVDAKEAVSRVASLSDAEIRDINGRLDTLPAGQGAIEAVLAVMLFLFLVFLITDLLGLTNIFPFVKSQSKSNR